MPARIINCEDSNIQFLRDKYPEGLHFVVGDTRGEWLTLQVLMDRICFDPEKDHVYFIGGNSTGVDPQILLQYLSACYQADCRIPGFHMIRGNREQELDQACLPDNLPDICVVPGKLLNFYIVHTGIVSDVFTLISDDVSNCPEPRVHAYRLDKSVGEYDELYRHSVWSKREYIPRRTKRSAWPSETVLDENRAYIIRGNTPYDFLTQFFRHGESGVYWTKQHIFFSGDMRSFNLDANVKGRHVNGETYRGITCLCLEACEEIAEANGGLLTADAVLQDPDCVFSAEYVPFCSIVPSEESDLSPFFQADPNMKTIAFDPDDNAVILD